MYRSLWCELGVTLKRTTTSSSTLPAKYFFRIQNQNVAVISKSRVTSIFSSFSTTTSNKRNNVNCSYDFDSSFVVSYLINSCGLSQTEAIIASKKINFKTTTKPDSVLTLLKTYGFTEPDISKLINKEPSILLSNPHKTLQPKLDFFKSKGIYEIELANFISRFPKFLTRGLKGEIIPSFEILKSIVHSDVHVIKMIKRNSWIISADRIKRVMVNVELLRNEGVPETNIHMCLSAQPRAYSESANRFKEILEKVKEMGFHHLQTTFLRAIHGLTSMNGANWRKKMDVYKRWGWSEDHIHAAFRKHPSCMMASEKKIMGIMNFLVNDMGHNSLSISGASKVFCYSLKNRIIPRCSVVKILVSKGLIQKKPCINSFVTITDKSFLEKYIKKYELEVPELMKVFQRQLNYLDLLQN
ncbi:uncharacterized protein LOC113313475 isoform X2 [Papaver somniferum]|uniref:uncharacterized protein LOC113313475 isoform X2 n=1 Tax=Papaver somniferum TaxID=3469 RepID=UPI000E6FDF78|nr:uncharacterized protein LOC113313475 isoform X2 [Papaver somniferum]XP_026418042.1 uncharacterized protein LOC113313475 isoform X2 [Papaver somniferum]